MRTITLLLVDDHPDFLTAAMRQFRKFPWIVVIGQAGNGIEAIQKSENLAPDAVLMDLNMPEMGGLQATRLIRTQDKQPFIVITSHFDDQGHREHAARAGADGFVSKLTYVADVIPLLMQLRDANPSTVQGQA